MRSIVLTRRGIGFLLGAVASFIAAPALSLPALLYVTGLLLALVVVSTVFVLAGHSRVRIDRTFAPHVVRPGELSRTTVRVTNLSTMPCLEARWKDALPHGISGESSGTLPALGGSRSVESTVSFAYSLQGLRRGRHAIGPLTVEVHDPFGLVVRRHAFGEAEPFTVLPRVVDLSSLSARGASEDGATRPMPHHVGLGDDDIIARSYLPGDALKRIHWKATAHRAELMVRQEEQQVTPRAGVHLDCDPSAHPVPHGRRSEEGQSTSFEWAVVAAASITAHLAKAGYVVALQSSGHAVDRLVAEGQDTLEDAMVDLAVVEPGGVDHETRIEPDRAAFAVLGHLTPDRARHWITTLNASRSVLALVSRESTDEVLDLLDGARWNVVAYDPRDDLAELWSHADGARADAAS